ncbi:MAG: hypothetical protein HOP13_11285 [Alphaproteobacteria bacterium]|nr:hypothetical protein [Alphaproteobacteria bacterium]
MAQNEHKLFTTPVSVNDGFKRSDGKTWAVLGIVALVAIATVVLINLFVEKPKVRWPRSPVPQSAPPESVPVEPRTYDVAPPEPARPR